MIVVKRSIKRILILLFIISNVNVFSQEIYEKTINDGQVVESEFDVAINPLDTNNIVLVTISKQGNKSQLSIYYSEDFGESWAKSDFTGLFGEYVSISDPTIEFDDNGTSYITYLGIKNFVSLDTLFVDYDTKYIKSIDNGKSWNILTLEAETGDKPWLVVDTFDQSPFKGNKYISGGGVNSIALDGNDNLLHNTVPDWPYYFHESMGLPCNAISKDGTIYIVYIARHNLYPGFIDSLMIVHSYNGGESFGQIRKDRNLLTYFNELPREKVGVSDRMGPKQYLAVDNSNDDFEGRIYLTYTNREDIKSTYLDVFLTYSDDDGKTWSEPQPVHPDAPRYTNQFFSSIFVNRIGYLMLDWYDSRNDDFGRSNDFYFGLSKDGGQTFKTIKLTSQKSDFTKIGIKNHGFGVGDYHQCVATDRYAFSFWADGRKNNGNINIYYAKIDLENIDSIIISRIPREIVIKKLYPNPTSNLINVDFKIKKEQNIKWIIYDNQGRKVNSSIYKHYTPIKNNLTINVENLSLGTYYLSLESKEGYKAAKKFVKI